MAKLYFYYASMNAGKSSTLLQAAFNYGERGMKVMLWTAAIDDRPGFGAISSRIGLAGDASRFEATTDIEAAVLRQHQESPLACILVDEAQFLSKEQVWQCARLADKANIRLYAMAFVPISRASYSPVLRLCLVLRIVWWS